MMSYNAKNYTEQGGEKTVIGGELVIEEGAKVTGLPVLENQPASTADTVEAIVTDFNALLSKLTTAGIMNGDTPYK